MAIPDQTQMLLLRMREIFKAHAPFIFADAERREMVEDWQQIEGMVDEEANRIHESLEE